MKNLRILLPTFLYHGADLRRLIVDMSSLESQLICISSEDEKHETIDEINNERKRLQEAAERLPNQQVALDEVEWKAQMNELKPVDMTLEEYLQQQQHIFTQKEYMMIPQSTPTAPDQQLMDFPESPSSQGTGRFRFFSPQSSTSEATRLT